MAPIRAALAALRADTAPATRAALVRLADAGHVALADTADALLERAVADWYAPNADRLWLPRPATPWTATRRNAPNPTARTARTRATRGGANGAGATARADPRRAGYHRRRDRAEPAPRAGRAGRAGRRGCANGARAGPGGAASPGPAAAPEVKPAWAEARRVRRSPGAVPAR